LHRNSGLTEFRTINCRKSGKPNLHRNSGLLEFRTINCRKSGKPNLHRNSGLPEFRTINCRKSGKPDLRCHERVHARPPTLRPAMTAFGLAPMRRRGNDNTEKG